MIRQQMRETVEQGIQGFLASCFAGGRQPIDELTGYPLTPENSAVFFSMQYPYQSIEDAYLKHTQWDDNMPLDTTQLQEWAAYFWQYARLTLRETFEPMPDYHTAENETNRDKWRNEVIAQGYRRVK